MGFRAITDADECKKSGQARYKQAEVPMFRFMRPRRFQDDVVVLEEIINGRLSRRLEGVMRDGQIVVMSENISGDLRQRLEGVIRDTEVTVLDGKMSGDLRQRLEAFGFSETVRLDAFMEGKLVRNLGPYNQRREVQLYTPGEFRDDNLIEFVEMQDSNGELYIYIVTEAEPNYYTRDSIVEDMAAEPMRPEFLLVPTFEPMLPDPVLVVYDPLFGPLQNNPQMLSIMKYVGGQAAPANFSYTIGANFTERVFTWDAAPDVEEYEFQWGMGNFNTVVITPNLTHTLTGLAHEQQIQARVRGRVENPQAPGTYVNTDWTRIDFRVVDPAQVPAYSFVRLTIHEGGPGGAWTGIREFNFRDSPGGPFIVGPNVVAVSSYAIGGGPLSGGSDAQLYDESFGSNNGRWNAVSELPFTFEYEFGTPQNITTLVLGAYSTNTDTINRSVTRIELEGSTDGVTWETILPDTTTLDWTNMAATDEYTIPLI